MQAKQEDVTEAEYQRVTEHALAGTYSRSQTKGAARLGMNDIGWRKELTLEDNKAAAFAIQITENSSDQKQHVLCIINVMKTSVKQCNLKAKQRDKAIFDVGWNKSQVDSLTAELKILNSAANDAKNALYDWVARSSHGSSQYAGQQ